MTPGPSGVSAPLIWITEPDHPLHVALAQLNLNTTDGDFDGNKALIMDAYRSIWRMKRKERHLPSARVFAGTWRVPLLVLESRETEY